MSSDALSVPAKLLSLLDAYSEGRTSFTLSELSRRAGLPLSTTHRLVGELERWGGLERSADGRYAIGLRLVELAAPCARAPTSVHRAYRGMRGWPGTAMQAPALS